METADNAIQVLLVDDHRVMREGTKVLLDQAPDIQVIAETDTQDGAIQMAQEHEPTVVLLDIKLRNGSGLEAARAIRKLVPQTKIIILSAYEYDQYVLAALRTGVNGYLLKDASASEVVDAIRTVASGGTVLAPSIGAKLMRSFSLDGHSGHGEEAAVLSAREMDVLELMAAGVKNADIAAQLSVSQRTIETHISSILTKLGAKTRTEAVSLAVRKGIVVLSD